MNPRVRRLRDTQHRVPIGARMPRREYQPGVDPAPPATPYPGDPERSTARCPRADDKHRPLHWDGETWRCLARSWRHGGHKVTPDAVIWGAPPSQGGRPATGEQRHFALGPERDARLAEIAAAETRGNESAALRALFDEAVAHRDAARTRGTRSTRTTTA